MKKFILAAALVAAMAPAAVAQDEFAPEKGDFGVELQFNPFSNDYTTFRDSEYGLTGRYFITNKDAIRLNIGFGVHKDIDNTDFETSENNYVTLHNNTRRSNFNINLGYERHLVTKGRLDVYAGAQVGVGFESYGSTTEQWNASEKVVEKYWENSANGEIGSTNFNFGIFTGVDLFTKVSMLVLNSVSTSPTNRCISPARKRTARSSTRTLTKIPLQRASTSALMCSPLSVSAGLSDNLLIV